LTCLIRLGLIILDSLSLLPPFLLFNIIFHGWTAPVNLGPLIIEIWRSHLDTPHSVTLLRTSDRPIAGTSTIQHTTHKRQTCSRRDSDQQSQQASGCRPTP